MRTYIILIGSGRDITGHLLTWDWLEAQRKDHMANIHYFPVDGYYSRIYYSITVNLHGEPKAWVRLAYWYQRQYQQYKLPHLFKIQHPTLSRYGQHCDTTGLATTVGLMALQLHSHQPLRVIHLIMRHEDGGFIKKRRYDLGEAV